MHEPSRNSSTKESSEASRDQAAEWFVRCDRGLNPEEEAEFERALQSNPALAGEMEKFEQTQDVVRKLPLNIAQELLAETDSSRSWNYQWLAAAALFALILGGGFLFLGGPETNEDSQITFQETLKASAHSKTRILPDGSMIRLNEDSEVQVAYSNAARQIHFLSGEAHFTVQKDPSRPFIVGVDKIQIRAIGTAFNVKRTQVVDVIVTEGTVRIIEAKESLANLISAGNSIADSAPNFVSRGQRAEVKIPSSKKAFSVDIFQVDQMKVEQDLQWQRSLLALEGKNLLEITSNFERKTGYRIIFADPSLRELQIGGHFPSNDVPSFLRILRDGYGIPSYEKEDGVFVLGK